jgi:TolB protein
MPYVAGSDSVPAWSPDGTHIAFVRAPSGGCGVRGEVWVVNVDGTGARPLVALSGDERHPTWSPDSQSIGFSSDVADPGNYDLYTVRADGTQRVRRTSDAEDDVGPSWGADGIVYTRGTFNCGGGSNQRLWFLPLSD